MKLRTSLFVLFLLGLLGLLTLSPTTPTPTTYADDPTGRPTPTPAPLPEGMEPLEPTDPTAPDAQFPDLVISAIRVLPREPIVNQAVTVEVVVSNIGPVPVADTNNFYVDLYINPETTPRACLPGQFAWAVQGFQIRSGSVTLRQTFYPESDDRFADFRDVGNVILWAQADTDIDTSNNRCGNVVETREDNNLRSINFNVKTSYSWSQTTPQEFQSGFSSALDLSHPLGILQNGTGWFEEPRFPQPEDPDWPVNPAAPWDSPTFYNPDRHIYADNLPDDYPTSELPDWNPPDQENVDISIGFNPDTLYAVWEDARNGDLFNRDIYFSYSPDRGKTWLEPIRINQDTGVATQRKPQLTVDRVGQRLFIFWEDNRLQGGDYDIFFARSLDFGFTWEEPTDPDTGQPVNPINDQNVDTNADQINVSAVAWYNDQTGQSNLFVAWEDYRNGNADIFFDWSEDGGLTWLKTADDDPATIDANIHVQPDPSSNAGIYDQQRPSIFLDSERLGADEVVNYCVTSVPRIIYYENGVPVLDSFHYYPANPLPRVFITWQDKRNSAQGDTYSIYYTRGEFNYQAPTLPVDPENGFLIPETPTCFNGGPRPAIAKTNLPVYRFEDDHVRVDGGNLGSSQLNPVGGFDGGGFLSYAFEQSYTTSGPNGPVDVPYICEARFRTDELVFTWEDDRDGTRDIFAANVFDDIATFSPIYAYVDDPDPEVSNPPFNIEPNIGCLSVQQGGIGANDAPLVAPPEFTVNRNIELYSVQPFEFYELAFPEPDLKISDGLTFTPKPQCLAPNEPTVFSSEPSDQTNPDLTVLPIPGTRIDQSKIFEEQTLVAKFGWGVWADTRSIDRVNQDIFLRPIVREDITRTLTIDYSENLTPDLPSFQFEDRNEIALQTVQDNVRNQILLRRPGLAEEYDPPSAQQDNPSVSFALFGDPDDLDNYAFYVGWDDNRNANPLIGYEGNRDVFAARLQLGDTINNGELLPTRTGTFISSVFGRSILSTWYDIAWWGDISADGVVSFQTRFGLDPNSPEPPQENVAANGWTQWTGVGGTGGFYTAPGQHITGADGSLFPQSYYMQYRVNFNPAGGGQQGIHCISQVNLNYEGDLDLYLPILLNGVSR